MTGSDLTAAQTRDVHYGYDALGRQLFARFDSGASTSDGVTNSYNIFGEMLTARLKMGTFDKTLAGIYDGAGRRTRLTHPDNQAFTYAYDPASRLTGVYQGTGTGTPLATFAYGNDGLVSSRSEGSGASGAAYGWDNPGRLTSQSDTFSGGTNNVSWTLAYNPASQVAAETRDNDNYGFAKTAANASYAVNGLNQYTAVGGTAQSYDANGNLTGTGAAAYTYDIENRLVKAVAGATTTNLVYDPLGRLFETNQGTSGTTTRFLNDGDALVLEFNSSNAVTSRYVHGSNMAADDPLVWYSGSGLTNKRWLHADRLGSIVAWTNASGGSPTINRYDEYGVPGATNSGRFQYTGQPWIGELGLYYYKARMYSPGLGRFMQVDPIGYEDRINLYAYVANDPVNGSDTTGLFCTGSRIESCGSGGLAPTYSGISTLSMTGRLEQQTDWGTIDVAQSLIAGVTTGLPDIEIEEHLDNALTFAALGWAGEEAAITYLLERGYHIDARHLYVRTSAGLRIVDIVATSPQGRQVAYEVKAGWATRSETQLKKDFLLLTEGGEVRSRNKLGFEQGSTIRLATGVLYVRCASSIGVCAP